MAPEASAARTSMVRYAVITAVLGAAFTALGPVLGDLSALTRAAVPAAALMVVCPPVAAYLVARREGTLRAWVAVLRRWRAPWWAWVVAAVLMPAVVVLSTRAPAGTPDPLPVGGVLALVAVFLVSAALENAGWSAFALPRMALLATPLVTGVLIGVFWALWHVVPYAQGGHSASWIAGQCVFTVVLRVLLVQLSVRSGNLMWPAVVAHASYNVAWAASPGAGTAYDPWVASAWTAAAALALLATAPRGARDRWPASAGVTPPR
ncbi:CPBP family glutamic-type intramembrane protease [Cellulomonas wangsupingiae]|uniref:CPBP family glutamic-type intramembrane protease n=1 Tax=Cellulomonas wangsupingiae TaxID=2968085 RepID=A0ABY5K6P7_9CELL|nr:CPBP family glutamic-type intramembrane protease [Cellulomonas wangsupingiae]MCC2334970.1 CPBP family intramembrane metalloprotease [Cellulomonas wangsupingiae]UUI65469.1 CPBP family glutamic-type intramembrane protease [Cellulomonas wangsupingiae]